MPDLGGGRDDEGALTYISTMVTTPSQHEQAITESKVWTNARLSDGIIGSGFDNSSWAPIRLGPENKTSES